jgi:hypothetical protein
MQVKDHVKSVLRISSAHNKGGSTDINITPQKNVCAYVGHKKDGEEFKCQIVNKNMAI